MTDKKKDRPFVFVRCMTYNHEKFIEDALNGFVMQQTDFQFVVAVVDDASTDNNASVISKWVSENCKSKENYVIEDRDYGRVILAQANNNPNCTFYVVLLKENHFRKKPKNVYYAQYENEAKYIAMCEGDDYWTDPYKLQKQVDFLEAHPEYDMVCTRFQHLYQENGIIEDVDLYNDIISEQSDGLELKHEHFMYSAIPHPCTVMYRRGTMEDNPILPKLKYRFDIPTYWCYMYYHRVWLMNIKTAVYRKHLGSLTDEGVNFRRKIYEAYADIYQYKPKDDLLRQLCATTFRNFGILPSAHQIEYELKDAFRDLKIYRTYKASIKELINVSYRMIKARVRVKILNPLKNVKSK